MKQLSGLLCLSALTFSLSGCAQEIETIETWNGSGAVSVDSPISDRMIGAVVTPPGGPCEGSTDYPDIRVGTTVTLRDSTGGIVSLSRLEVGTHVEIDRGWSGLNPVDCVLDFQFVDVESDDKFFSVEVGSRGEVNTTREDLEFGLVALNLG